MRGFAALGRLALGQPPGGASTAILSAAAGAFSLAGSAATFNTSVPATSAAYALTGRGASFVGTLTCGTQSYVLSGIAAAFNIAMPETAGSYALTGNAAVFASAL